MYRNVYVEVNTKIIKKNIKNIIKYNEQYKYYIGVVKGNAYGHGLKVSKYMIESGVNYLATATLDEALEIRSNVDKNIPVLILQPVNIENIDICIKNNITITISNYDYYQELNKLDVKKLKVHLKIDSGMNRLGLNNKDNINDIYHNHHFILEGIYTHLATIGISDNRFDKQINKFKELTSNIDLKKIEMVHLYSSNAFIIHPKLDFASGVRLGIVMFGVSPRNLNNKGFKNYLRKIKRDLTRRKLKISAINDDFTIDVEPALQLCSEVSEIKEIEKDEYVGYGNRYKTDSKCKIAIVQVGYMDGLSLNNSGRNVLINGKNYPIVGVVNMGMITIKVDDTVKVHDKVIIIKNIREISSYTHTTPHQLLTSISPLIERRYIEGDE
ncbi:MAG: alanine racemase [Bacilli bacterium]|nr:alanine racemase [Bacilli bacterium]